jgi:hypothetical protein
MCDEGKYQYWKAACTADVTVTCIDYITLPLSFTVCHPYVSDYCYPYFASDSWFGVLRMTEEGFGVQIRWPRALRLVMHMPVLSLPLREGGE